MRLLSVAFTLLLASAGTGCLGPGPWDPIEIDLATLEDPILGHLEFQRVTATSERTATPLEGAVEVQGSLHGGHVEDIQVDAYLVTGRCPLGPTGTPSGWISKVRLHLGDLAEPTTVAFEATLRRPLAEGAVAHVIVTADAERAIGPIFGECRELSPLP